MKQLNKYINEWKANNSTITNVDNRFHPKTFKELDDIIRKKCENKNNEKHLDLQDIDVSGISTFGEKNYRGYWGLFGGYTDVETINITGWDTSNVTSMNDMFWHCKSLETIIGIEDIDVSNVSEMDSLFQGCKKLDVDISLWEPDNLTSCRWMFDECDSMTDKIPSWANT